MDRKNTPFQSDTQDRILGSLIGGAAGDALGYAVEFSDETNIFSFYGKEGISSYHLDPESGKALVSDDTQMTLFTANALIFGMYRQNQRGISAEPRHYALYSYLGWLITQQHSYSEETRIDENSPVGWASFMLADTPELYQRRAPGMTCLSALQTRKDELEKGLRINDFLAAPINNSKGCGGIMRVAPLGLALHFADDRYIALEGAQLSAITHSHSLGYMSSSVLALILKKIITYGNEMSLKEIIKEARDITANVFKGDKHVKELCRIIDLAIFLSENEKNDLDNIHKLGEGWVAEETLAIAIYCSLKYSNDFSKALCVSVNHNGDSDSTGAVTGNIMGAVIGFDRIPPKWKETLEMSDLITDIGHRLYEDFK